MQLIVLNIHKKIIKIHFLILIVVVVANGGLLIITGDYLLIFCIIANQYAVKNINQKSLKIPFLILIAVVVSTHLYFNHIAGCQIVVFWMDNICVNVV